MREVTLQPPTSENPHDHGFWVVAAQNGDNSAFEELVRRTQDLARTTAYPVVGPDQMDDAVQEAYLIAYRKLHLLRDPKAFAAWLVRIVLRVSYGLRGSKPTKELREVNSQPDFSTNSVARLDLDMALARLKAKDRDILIMRELLRFSYEEIAYTFRLPLGTVRSRLHHARLKLADLMGDTQ